MDTSDSQSNIQSHNHNTPNISFSNINANPHLPFSPPNLPLPPLSTSPLTIMDDLPVQFHPIETIQTTINSLNSLQI